jgi:hypothetical protein
MLMNVGNRLGAFERTLFATAILILIAYFAGFVLARFEFSSSAVLTNLVDIVPLFQRIREKFVDGENSYQSARFIVTCFLTMMIFAFASAVIFMAALKSTSEIFPFSKSVEAFWGLAFFDVVSFSIFLFPRAFAVSSNIIGHAIRSDLRYFIFACCLFFPLISIYWMGNAARKIFQHKD